MYICGNCKIKLSSYRYKCPACGVRNVNYNNYKAILIIAILCSIGYVILDLLVFPFPGYTNNIQRGVFILALIVGGYYYAGGNKERKCIRKSIIRVQGNNLLKEKDKFSLEDLSIACGWQMDNTEVSEKFKTWTHEVAAEEQWELITNQYTRSLRSG